MKAAQSSRHPQELIPPANSGTVCPPGELKPSSRTIVSALLVMGVCVSIASCASTTAPYNPNHLSADHLSQVGEVCQTMMGFRPSETLTDSVWPANPDRAVSTNRYRGCVATLSTSLKRAAGARATKQVEQDCVSQGFSTGSSDLALCVLTAQEAPTPATQIRLASTTVMPFLIPTTPSYAGHVPATVPKEQLACAEIGLDPNEDVFAGCVQGLERVNWAPFFDDSYRG